MISSKLQETLDNILNNAPEDILLLDHWCLVDQNKFPYNISSQDLARTSNPEDFMGLDVLDPIRTKVKFVGLGALIKYIGAIDIDSCVESPFDKNTITPQALELIHYFKSYTEFSFSGRGIRILFSPVGAYNTEKYYLKNSSLGIEFYIPQQRSPRYVTITGRRIFEEYDYRKIDLSEACEKWMKRPILESKKEVTHPTLSDEDVMKKVRYYLLINSDFQDNYYLEAPGSGSNESERDFHLVSFIYNNITTNPDQIIMVFESSNFYKTKDEKHLDKWHKRDHSHFWSIYNKIKQ